MYKKYVLDNGLRVVCEKIPYVRSVSIGLWIGTGSRRENERNNGVSHFIEHMLFKGTKNRSAKEIAETIANIGGQINAFTGKECTCYYTKTLDSHIDVAFDVLADMFFNSNFDPKDISLERKVILEEIKMYEDSPEELVHDTLSEIAWKDNSLGYPILGNEQCLRTIDAETMKNYISMNYIPSNCVVSVAGNFDETKLIDTVKKYFGRWEKSEFLVDDYQFAEVNKAEKYKHKDIEQVHICFGFNAIEHGNEKLYALLAINNIFGAGMSSRLFQRIREEKGLVYTIYSYPSSYKNAGIFTIYSGMKPENLENVCNLIIDEIKTIKETKITKEELERSKDQLRGNYILGLESTGSRMNSLGKTELMLGKIFTPDEVLNKIENINLDSAIEVIEEVFDFDKMCFAAVGPMDDKIV